MLQKKKGSAACQLDYRTNRAELLESRRLLSAAIETPFLANAYSTNAMIPAVNYDRGGEGTAYHYPLAGNPGGDNYRPTDSVGIQQGGTTGHILAYAVAGEWINYTLDIPATDQYVLKASVANAGAGGAFHVDFIGQGRSGPITVPNTASWFNYQTVTSTPMTLAAGQLIMHVALDQAAVNRGVANFDWFDVVPAPAVSTPVPGNIAWQPAAANPVAIAESQGATVNGKFYVIGGHEIVGQNWVGISQTDVFDPIANTWTRLADAPQRLSEAAVTAAGQNIYVAGGYVTNSRNQQIFANTGVWRYDTVANTWQPFVPLPQPRAAGRW